VLCAGLARDDKKIRRIQRAMEINGSKADIEKLLSKPEVVEEIWGSKRVKIVVNGSDVLTGSRSKSESKRTYRYDLLVRKTARSKGKPAARVRMRSPIVNLVTWRFAPGEGVSDEDAPTQQVSTGPERKCIHGS